MYLQQFLVLRINTGSKIALKCYFFAPRPLEVKKWEWLTERAWSKTFRFIDTKAKLWHKLVHRRRGLNFLSLGQCPRQII